MRLDRFCIYENDPHLQAADLMTSGISIVEHVSTVGRVLETDVKHETDIDKPALVSTKRSARFQS